MTVSEGIALCTLILLLASGVESQALCDANTTTAPSGSSPVGADQGGIE